MTPKPRIRARAVLGGTAKANLKVVNFKQPPVKKLVEILEACLEKAKAGELSSVIIGGGCFDGQTMGAYYAGKTILGAIGELEVCKNEVMRLFECE